MKDDLRERILNDKRVRDLDRVIACLDAIRSKENVKVLERYCEQRILHAAVDTLRNIRRSRDRRIAEIVDDNA